MSRRYVYRDYRPGHHGEFTSEETFNRSQGQGVTCHVHRERVETGTPATLEDIWEFDDYPDEELYEYEFHGTGDTGKAKR